MSCATCWGLAFLPVLSPASNFREMYRLTLGLNLAVPPLAFWSAYPLDRATSYSSVISCAAATLGDG